MNRFDSRLHPEASSLSNSDVPRVRECSFPHISPGKAALSIAAPLFSTILFTNKRKVGSSLKSQSGARKMLCGVAKEYPKLIFSPAPTKLFKL
jgi:hypothetical protein